MNIQQVIQRLDKIREAADDCEVAHGLEDQLFVDVLDAIANSRNEDPAHMLAAAALVSRDLDFPRYTA